MTKIGVVTSGRWDYSYLKSIFEELENEGFVCTWFVLTEKDSEFSKLMSNRYSEKSLNIEMDDISENREQMSLSLAKMQRELTSRVKGLDYAVLLGDRAEIFACASVLFYVNIPFAHLAAGDRTKGAFDDNFRFAISSLADTHFAFSVNSLQILRSTQLNSSGIFLTHPPQYSRMISESQSTIEELTQIIKFDASLGYVLLTFHVETKSSFSVSDQVRYIQDLISELTRFTYLIVTSPNSDPGSQEILAMLEDAARSNPKLLLFGQLGEPNYWKVLRAASCIVGNSSSGIYEAPLLRVPVVNIGKRQDGRISPVEKLDIDWAKDSAIATAATIKSIIERRSAASFIFQGSLIGESLTEKIIWRIKQLEA